MNGARQSNSFEMETFCTYPGKAFGEVPIIPRSGTKILNYFGFVKPTVCVQKIDHNNQVVPLFKILKKEVWP
jgi:hypothetical protein